MKAFVIVTIITLTLCLSGCAATKGLVTPDGKPITQALVISKCPTLKQYTPEQLKAAAAEMKQLASTSALAMLVTDYGKMRDACRALTKKLKTQ